MGINKMTQQEFIVSRWKYFESEYTVLSKFTGTGNPLWIKHNDCGKEFRINTASDIERRPCPSCKNQYKGNTEEQYIRDLTRIHKDRFSPMSKFTSPKNEVIVQCNYCLDYIKIFPSRLLTGNFRICENCIAKKKRIHRFNVKTEEFSNSSKGEVKIYKALLELGCKKEDIEIEYTGFDCSYKNILRFDVVIMEKLIPKVVIEYDGEGHFMSIDLWGGESGLIEYKIKDDIKTTFCKDNNIPLIRIPYWEFDNIEAILEKELAALGVTKEELIEPVLT